MNIKSTVKGAWPGKEGERLHIHRTSAGDRLLILPSAISITWPDPYSFGGPTKFSLASQCSICPDDDSQGQRKNDGPGVTKWHPTALPRLPPRRLEKPRHTMSKAREWAHLGYASLYAKTDRPPELIIHRSCMGDRTGEGGIGTCNIAEGTHIQGGVLLSSWTIAQQPTWRKSTGSQMHSLH